jgi:5-(carboxyamino)imidazole ribonucleotide synthase
MIIAPGGTIGILGGGQLGRMLGIAAAQLGYRVHIYAPGASGPASEVAWRWTRGAYDDADSLRAFAAEVDVVTYEFENIEAGPLDGVGNIAPGVRALDVAQDRLAEKRFCESVGGRPARYMAIDSRADLDAALSVIGTPAVLKTRRFGYDGKGQARLRAPGDADTAWAAIGGQPAILEAMVAFDHEFSILLARGHDGAVVRWDAVENIHEDGVLRTSTVPASPAIAAQFDEAADLASRIADELDYVGVLACEFFASVDGPVFNEMAPRVHNSGHWTIEGAITSQFENHIRAICGLPLGATGLSGAGAQMRNLLGYEADDWATILADPEAHLHLYGKSDPRPGRKMGHVTKVF